MTASRRWPFYVIILTLLGLVLVLREMTDKPQPVAEVLVERPQVILYRTYWNTPWGDRYFLVAEGEKERCEVDFDGYMRSFLGQEFTCVWKKL